MIWVACLVFSTQAASATEFATALRPLLAQTRDSLFNRDFSSQANLLRTSYARREYAPLWFRGEQLSGQARQLLKMLNAAADMGLDPREYGADKLIAEFEHDRLSTTSARARFDLALSISALTYISHLHFGRIDPASAGFDMPERSSVFDAGSMLEQLASTEDLGRLVASVEPPFQHYALLKQALLQYRQLAAQPELTQLPTMHAVSIKSGDTYDGIPALRRLLFALGDLRADVGDSGLMMNETMVEAIKRFQFRHGLAQDGALGKATYAALTVPLSDRARQIELTLERWRWLPVLNGPTIIVNIPQFRLFAFTSQEDRESDMLTMDVIVGKTYPRTHTPVFAADMKYVVFRPYWDVPSSITRNELLPQIRAKPGYLAAEDLEIVDSESDSAKVAPATSENLTALATGKLRIRQRPGPNNSLGLVKFMLPNKYNVYLHSTPAKQLFQQSRRAFSHGCIRVSDPVALAEYALRNASGEWSRDRIEARMAGPDNARIELKQRIRVLIVYGTAVATESKGVYFFADIYENDARLMKLLANRTS